jgi:DNA-binding transcriptional LysR family regulator
MTGSLLRVVLAAETILREPLLVALPREHPLASAPAVPLAALAGERFVLFPRPLGPSLYDQILALCERAGFRPRVQQEARQMPTIARLVGAGIGVSLVPASVQSLGERGVVYRPLESDSGEVEMALVWRRDDHSALLQRFLAAARESAAPARVKSDATGC